MAVVAERLVEHTRDSARARGGVGVHLELNPHYIVCGEGSTHSVFATISPESQISSTSFSMHAMMGLISINIASCKAVSLCIYILTQRHAPGSSDRHLGSCLPLTPLVQPGTFEETGSLDCELAIVAEGLVEGALRAPATVPVAIGSEWDEASDSVKGGRKT